MKEYEKAKETIRGHLKNDNIKEVIRNTELKARTEIVLKVGKPLIYFGELATDIYRYVNKKRYSEEENPARKLKRCPECNKRDSIFEHESKVFCNKCDYVTTVTVWNKENKHLQFDIN